ncbi:MAG TPA: hypothetical protein VFQ38_17100, partial [Longimicrobiales bacterium]|nr:hypothetical protein [Longimicrobiales bacterium]
EHALPPRPPGPADPFVLMDRMDDEAILAELEGLVADTLVYHYRDGGRDVWGLAKAGVDEACAHLANQGYVIREEALRYRVDERRREAYFCVQAARYAVFADGHEVALDKAWGAKRQPLLGDAGRLNPHWFEQGAMKAARNARSRLIGAELKARIIELARETGKVRDVGAAPAGSAGTASPGGPTRSARPAGPRASAAAVGSTFTPDGETPAPAEATPAPAATVDPTDPTDPAAPAPSPRQLQTLRRLLRGPDVPETLRRRVAARLDAGQLSAEDARRAIGFLSGRRRLDPVRPAGPPVRPSPHTPTSTPPPHPAS